MKVFLVIVTMIFALQTSYGQILENDTISVDPNLEEPEFSMYSAGDELKIASDHMLLGFSSFAIAGGSIFLAEAIHWGNENLYNAMVYSALFFTITASALKISSMIHIGKAGVLLNEYGIGVKIPIK